MKQTVFGTCADHFAPLFEEFSRNFQSSTSGRDVDLGAAVSVTLNGETVVDLWGGYQDAQCQRPWQADTMVCVFSVTKAVAAACIHVLHSRGVIDIDAPIANQWPDFAQNGKAGITPRMVLSHTAGLMAPTVPAGSLWEPGILVGAIERMAPEWEPGTQAGYHSFTFGPILQEVVRLATRQSLGTFLRDDIALPFSVDFAVGLTPAENARCADLIGNDLNGTIAPFRSDPAQDVYHHWAALPRTEDFNSANWRGQEFFSLAGHGNARGIAKLLSPFANRGLLDGSPLIAPDHLTGAIAQHWSGRDNFSQSSGRFAAGFQMADETYPFGGRPECIGHYGIGGSVGFADPVAHLTFSYTPNRLISGGAGKNRLSERLIKAVYSAL